MNRLTLAYWIVTGLMALYMSLGAGLDVVGAADARALITHLGYPLYFMPYIGVLKLLGIIAVLVPGYARLKEWAYAGLLFDVTGALYSAIAVGDALPTWIPAFLGIVLIGGSYALYRWRSRLDINPLPARTSLTTMKA